MLKHFFWCALVVTGGAQAATFSHYRLDNGMELIELNGDIKSGDEIQFRKIALQFDKAIVGFNSDGGALFPALEIGKAVRLQSFETAVVSGNRCASACALIWAAGTNRYLVKGGRVGFHASYVEDGGKVIETGLGNALVGRYLTQIGLSEKAIIFATYSHPDSIAWLSEEADAATSGIPFNFSTPSPSSPSNSATVAQDRSPQFNKSYTTVQNWDIYRNKTDCAAVQSYESNTVLAIHYNASRHDLSAGFSYPEGQSLKEDDQRQIDVKFVTRTNKLDDGWKNVSFTVSIVQGEPILSSQWLKDPAFEDFSNAKAVGFYYQNKQIKAYDLAGLSAAMAEVARCSKSVNHINPKDVFAQ